ncbi:hypothetical protein [Bacillus sp. OK048]|uniref:hypothetical protein n=1 Tax=Bacillus sp. OK048 TaxID=1882761 RepID=UPI0011146773|nr:hypothetical protein [Bacillus sp. OK048]
MRSVILENVIEIVYDQDRLLAVSEIAGFPFLPDNTSVRLWTIDTVDFLSFGSVSNTWRFQQRS